MPSDLPKFTLRVPKELLEKVRKLAALNGRSLNKEIEYLLQQYVNKNSDNL